MLNSKALQVAHEVEKELNSRNVPYNFNSNHLGGFQFTFPWCKGDFVCCEGSYGCERGLYESFRFEEDKGDVRSYLDKKDIIKTILNAWKNK